MTKPLITFALSVLLVSFASATARQTRYRTLNDPFEPPKITSVEAWNQRASYLREHILATAGLMPMPEKTPLNAEVEPEKLSTREIVTIIRTASRRPPRS